MVAAMADRGLPGIRALNLTLSVAQLFRELTAHPELWDEFDLRTNHPQSPHRELSDIFVRYNARANFQGDRQAFNAEHESVWWPTIEKLPSIYSIVWNLMKFVEGERLGMVLVTKIPAGKTCYAHTDNGWHARYYEKYAVQIASAPGQAFHVEDAELSAKPGEVYWFDNARTHWVMNESDQDRITLIVCIRNRFTGVQ